MALFGRKKERKPSQSEIGPAMQPSRNVPNVPTEEVSSMRQQGYSNDQIIQALQDKGYNSNAIFNAMSQADVAQPAGPLPMEEQQDMPQMQGMPPPMSPFQEQEMYPPPWQESPISAPEKERIEEVAEAIIEEKWKEIIGDINKVIEWKRTVDSKLDKIAQQINDLKTNFDNLHKGVLGRISEYDKNLTSVGVEIKAMEKVFQKVLPTFTENVNKLSRLVKK